MYIGSLKCVSELPSYPAPFPLGNEASLFFVGYSDGSQWSLGTELHRAAASLTEVPMDFTLQTMHRS